MTQQTDDLSNLSMMELFRMEVETHAAVLNDGLLALDHDPTLTDPLIAMMRAAHSVKGAARLVNCDMAVRVAHSVEDSLTATQRGELVLSRGHIDVLLNGVDILSRIAHDPAPELGASNIEAEAFLATLVRVRGDAVRPSAEETISKGTPSEGEAQQLATSNKRMGSEETMDRSVRVTAGNLSRLLGLASESLVESRWLDTFASSLLQLKRLQAEVDQSLSSLRLAMSDEALNERLEIHVTDMQRRLNHCRETLGERQVEVESFHLRSLNVSNRLYEEVLDCRMRPFGDSLGGFQRMIRDLARSLGKEVKLDIIGKSTPVDRDILDRLEAPLNHLLRNAIDHGIETPKVRREAGKPEIGTIRMEAGHRSGILNINVSDDGQGIKLEPLRAAIVHKRLTSREAAERMADHELFQFLFLPGFTMKDEITEISGRGVGLDVVQEAVTQVDGTVDVFSEPGRSTRFQLHLPLTISVIRAILVEIGGEPYAFPLARIKRVMRLPVERVESVEGRQHFTFEGQQIGLMTASQVLRLDESGRAEGDLSVLILGDKRDSYGVVVDRFLGEQELAVRVLDSRLGKIKDIGAAALMPDRRPVLIIDVEDLILSIRELANIGHLNRIRTADAAEEGRKRKKVLVVDDSLTVRELERKLLEGNGYSVEIAVDGMHGWNSVRSGTFDLVITDVDMPRMDGIELVSLIKKDIRLRSLPVIIISYKDREEDHRRGLEAGADYYLTKGSFHDETFLVAVADLIGTVDEHEVN